MQLIKKLLYILSRKEKRQAFLLLLMVLVMALLDMVGVASIMPFMAVLTNPEVIETNSLLNKFYTLSSLFGVETQQQFLFFLGAIVFILLVASLTFKALTLFIQVRFTSNCQYSIAKRLVEGYLYQPYSWFLNRNSADLGKTILSEVGLVISKGLGPMMSLISQIVLVSALLILLILTDPMLTLISSLTIGAVYFSIYRLNRRFISRMGESRLKANQWLFTTVSEAFGAAKEVKLSGLEQVYTKRFSGPAKILAKNTAIFSLISHLPRYFLEALVFGGMLLVVLYLISQSGTLIDTLPIIALYAFAGYRLMPAMQQIYTSVTSLRFVSPSIDAMYNDLKSLKSSDSQKGQAPLPFNKSITLKNIYYQYPNASQSALKNLYIDIPARSKVALVGVTGCGKTTTADIILGLLEPKQGKLEVDGYEISKYNRRAWQQNIGYVPQNIFLSDDTIAANIAFGVNSKFINQKNVESAAKIAKLHEFVIDELPQQYQTPIGERGVRLSGGQRQRIGIARALYHNPKILILDEATSALDNITEKAVMEAVNNITHDVTIIIIAHRLNSVKNCDTIFLLEKGQLKQQGTFSELVKNNDFFNTDIYKKN